jgi:steroid delta-isomerase-like uncharacterized protein
MSEDGVTLEANKAVIRRYFELWNAGNIDGLVEIIAPDVVDHSAYEGQATGIEGYREFFTLWKTAFPDFVAVADQLVAEGDLVAYRWHQDGTNLGAYHDLPPTGRRVRFTAISISRIRDGKIVEDWINFDEAGLRRQIS